MAAAVRTALAGSLVLAAAALVLGASGRADPDPPPDTGSTLAATWRDLDGDALLERAGGERLVDRTALGPRARAGATLATLVQISDAHVVDEESPARVEMLDRLGDPFTGAFRPDEALSAHVLAGVVRSAREARPDAVLVTGDLIDNAQRNELQAALAVLRGGRVDPSSGARRYEGVQAAGNADPLIYRPDLDPPRHAGLLEAAQRPFRSPGLGAPWYPLVGNHDLLVQGVAAPTPATRRIAVGSQKLVRIDDWVRDAVAPRGWRPSAVLRRQDEAAIDALLRGGLPGTSMRVTPDAGREELSAGAAVASLRRASGHGGSGPSLDDVVDVGPSLRLVLLDTARRDRGPAGTVRPEQVAWLRRQLASAGRRFVVVVSSTPLASTPGAAPALAALAGEPRVVAALAGDHRNAITPVPTPAGGYWAVATSSLAEYPQQARVLRLRATAGGGVAIETWMLDADPRARLASVARELAFLDVQGGRPEGLAGGRDDRNARLYRAAPDVSQ